MTTKTALVLPFLALALGACTQPSPTPAVSNDEPSPQASAAPAEDPGALRPASSAGAIAATRASLAADAPKGGFCALDVANGKRRLPAMSLAAGSALSLGGWASTASMVPPTDGQLLFRGETESFSAPISIGGSRPDVARVKKSEALATSGFNAKVSTAGIPAGAYRLGILVDATTSTWCDLSTELTLR